MNGGCATNWYQCSTVPGGGGSDRLTKSPAFSRESFNIITYDNDAPKSLGFSEERLMVTALR